MVPVLVIAGGGRLTAYRAIVAAGTLASHWGGTLVLVVLVPGKLTAPDAGGVRADFPGRARRAEGAPVAGWRPVGA